jgi:drug/metabolite transporter (DMT)-like permease
VIESILFGLLAAISWGVCDFLFVKPIRENDALKATFFLSLLCATLAWVFAFSVGFTIPSFEEFSLSIIPGLCFTFAFLFFLKGLQVGRVSLVSPISSSYPILTALLAFVFLGEILSLSGYAGFALIVLGVAFASLKVKFGKHPLHLEEGVLFAFVALFFWGIGFFFLNDLNSAIGFASALPLFLTVRVFFLALLCAFYGVSFTIPRHFKQMAVASFFMTTGFAAYLHALSTGALSIVTVVASSFPAITIFLAHLFIGERLRVVQYVGVFFILFGVMVLSI